MSLAEHISQDMLASMKAKDSATLSTLRLLVSALKYKKIDVQHDLSDVEVQDVVKMQVKQLRDSIVSFEAGGRPEMVTSAQTEITVLEKYLPAQISDEALHAIVVAAIAESGATSKADMGKVMGIAVKAAAGGADGTRVKNLVMQLLPVILLSFLTLLTLPSTAMAAIPIAAEDFGIDAGFIELGLRIFRVLILWLGIPAIMLILKGGFIYMTASNNDDHHKDALAQITKGFFVTIMVILVFSFSTIILGIL
ncbi:MAG: GatB/YqeY domain-containing protein [Patescibacteria group bacterium]